jgi:hypothetical protein
VVARESRPHGLSAADVAAHLSLPLATKVGTERDLPAAMDQGRFDPRPRGRLARAAEDILDLFTSAA